MATRPLFEHRHFAWLAQFAAQHLTSEQVSALSSALEATNPNFDAWRFGKAAQSTPINWRDSADNNDMRGLAS